MKKVNWKGNLIALGIVVGVSGIAGYQTYKQNQETTAVNKEFAAIGYNNNNDNSSDDSPIVDDSYMNTPVENSDDNEQTKQDPSIGEPWQKVVNSSWGEPEDKTTTKDQYGTTELWIYSGGRSLFFEDGILESITQ
jgi:hypothetical protein